MYSGIRFNASNLGAFHNPPFSIEDFLKMYPQFEGKIDVDVMQMYIDFANSCLEHRRWGKAWRLGMSYFIAHFCTVDMIGRLDAESTEAQVLSVAQSKGLVSSKSAGDVSVSYDFGAIMEGLEGWGQWKLTTYGIQFASMARIIGKGAVYVW